MKIVVCVKQILDPRGVTVNRRAEKIFVNREEYLLDQASKAALEIAGQLKSAGDEIIALSVGPARVDDALREAMARGADRAILLRSDEVLDGFVVTNLLAAAIRKLGGAELIVTGDRSIDTGAGEVAPRLAEALDLPQVLRAVKVDLQADTLSALVQQEVTWRRFGSFASVETRLPLVLSVLAEAFSGRHPDGWRLMDAYKVWTVDTWAAAELGVSDGDLRPLTTKKDNAFPPERQLGTQVRDAKELAMMLKREKIIA